MESIQQQRKVLITGSSGFIGKALMNRLNQLGGFEIYTMVRRVPTSARQVQWDPERSTIDEQAITNIQPDIVVHLAGENIKGFWTEDKKRRILESRTKGTKLLCDTLASMSNPPSVFISASGCTYYGTSVTMPVDESGAKGIGFFPDVVDKWESSADSLQGRSRVSFLRLGIVLDVSGGFLQLLYYPFYFGLGGVVGSGDQWLPWVSLDDTLASIVHLINTEQCSGPFNIVSPNPVTNFTFTKTMGKVLNRPTVCWIPAILLTFALGKEMANETALSSQRVIPTKLIDTGYKFIDSHLESTLIKQFNSSTSNQATISYS
ncbi:NAD-dependent epimerase/dehydratase family protein [Cavenderia fasciculata]|uniref:NAD-dependent epimerase/dehydratase family protein n=1 Tax=Cavenderia fasciculata TaxID=261658 RepID=F4Q996_CACFS|nr:NAD-dependent epimerase/dehydratase family protein [Cavenderia fasciculata]EGG15265.1 NAD-dependent epimerase/dehydratase family protein [Cavenderia fasciculata]|eukprot:XP_004351985.1 NAD-dependent epimerase/dehydratase family protein [Cavenderia fasciculata]